MNTRQLQYAVLLSEIGNFSQVAEKLNISQPALSKQIRHLESELGVLLFNRSNNPVTLTPAGEYFVSEAKELLFKEDQLLRSMEQFKSEDQGQLVIGITPFRSSYLIPKVVKQLRVRFPRVQVKLHEAGSDILRKEAAEGKFDFAVINLPVDETVFDVTPIEPDRLVLVVPTHLLEQRPELRKTAEIDFADSRALPFVVVGPTQEMRKQFDALCAAAEFRPTIAAEVVGLTTAWEMASAGVGATLLPMQFVTNEMTDEKLTVLKIKNSAYLRQPAILTRKGQYLSKFARYAIRLLAGEKQ